MSTNKDFLDEIVEERTAVNPDFPALVEAALRTRQLLRELAAARKRLHMSQKMVAGAMGTSQEAISRLERGETDPRVSTVERYALAIGAEIRHREPALPDPTDLAQHRERELA